MTQSIETEQINQVENNTSNTFTLIKQSHGVAHLVMDVAGEAMNTLKAEFAEQILEIITEIAAGLEKI